MRDEQRKVQAGFYRDTSHGLSEKIKFMPHYSVPLPALPFDSTREVFFGSFFLPSLIYFLETRQSKFGELGPNLENRHGFGGSILCLKQNKTELE